MDKAAAILSERGEVSDAKAVKALKLSKVEGFFNDPLLRHERVAPVGLQAIRQGVESLGP